MHFLFNDPPTSAIYTLSLHDALPISSSSSAQRLARLPSPRACRMQVSSVLRQDVAVLTELPLISQHRLLSSPCFLYLLRLSPVRTSLNGRLRLCSYWKEKHIKRRVK